MFLERKLKSRASFDRLVGKNKKNVNIKKNVPRRKFDGTPPISLL